MMRMSKRLNAAAIVLVALITSACAAAAGAAAGAAAAIAYNERNASADVPASVSDLAAATEAVFAEMGITLQHREAGEGGTEVDIHGRAADGTDVAVDIDNEGGPTTRVIVTAREGQVEWKPTYAGRILEQIIDRVS